MLTEEYHLITENVQMYILVYINGRLNQWPKSKDDKHPETIKEPSTHSRLNRRHLIVAVIETSVSFAEKRQIFDSSDHIACLQSATAHVLCLLAISDVQICVLMS